MTNTNLPTASSSTERTRFNAMKHGLLSRYTVLPWEDVDEYQSLKDALFEEHQPEGPTEVHLVEEIAGIIWRKRRLRLAEAASHRLALNEAVSPWRETAKVALAHLGVDAQSESINVAILAENRDPTAELEELEQDEAMTRRALKLLGSKRKDPYTAALEALHEDSRQWWEEALAGDLEGLSEDEEPPTADVASLKRFIEVDLIPWYSGRREEIANRPLLREQAFGEAVDLTNLEKLSRYEVHLDRKMERTLTMLIRLQELRSRTADS